MRRIDVPRTAEKQGGRSDAARQRSDGARGQAAGRVISVDRLLDEAPWGAFQKWVLFLASLTIVFDGLDAQTLSLALPTITRDWHVGREQFGIVLALGFVTMAIGTVYGGMLGDRAGRRFALLASMVVFGAGTLATATTDGVWTLGVTRLFSCVGLGAAMPNATALVTEYTPRRYRSLAVGIALGSVPIGAFIGGMVAAYTLSHGSWRYLFIITGTIPLAGAVLLAILLPESIRFLTGRPHAGRRIAALLRKLGHAADDDDIFVDDAEPAASRASIRELFALCARDTIILSASFFLVIFANLFVISWTPALLADLALPPAITSMGIATFSIGGLFGALAGAGLFARVGSRAALSVMMGGAVLITLLLGVLPIGPTGLGGPTLLVILFLGGAFIPGGQVLLFALAGQLYPTAIRATGVGFAAAIGRIGAVLSGLAGPFILPFGSSGFFLAVAVTMLVSGILLRFMRMEVPASRARGLEPAVALVAKV